MKKIIFIIILILTTSCSSHQFEKDFKEENLVFRHIFFNFLSNIENNVLSLDLTSKEIELLMEQQNSEQLNISYTEQLLFLNSLVNLNSEIWGYSMGYKSKDSFFDDKVKLINWYDNNKIKNKKLPIKLVEKFYSQTFKKVRFSKIKEKKAGIISLKDIDGAQKYLVWNINNYLKELSKKKYYKFMELSSNEVHLLLKKSKAVP